jgi:serine/threonine protein kinase
MLWWKARFCCNPQSLSLYKQAEDVMGPTQNCPICGQTVTPEAPQGLCPECLLKTGIETKSGAEPNPTFTPLSLAEISPLFPQLEIIELLGQGGMGAVYKARQPRLNRLVALKILAPEKQADPQFAERFEREARTLAALNHPNIVSVYDFGEVRGIFYLLMEFVDGLTLRRIYQTRKLSPDEALAIVPKICDALQYAHEQGVVHRDIKPENILIDKNGQVKIADFGIAKIRDLEARDLALTGAQDVVGTPHYMAPEQIEKPLSVDSRADIYSLGVVFYEMLTGELPLGKFPPPSRKAPIDARLDHVVLHSLEKEPADRYQYATEVKTDVVSIASTPTPVPPVIKTPAPERESHWWKLIAVVCVIGFITVVTVLLLEWSVAKNRPAAWWRADGNTLDSANKNYGVIVNNVGFTNGVSGSAFMFDGDGSFVKIPSSSELNPASGLTIEFWMKADADSLRSYAGLVAGDFYLVEISSGGQHGRMGINFAISTDKGKSLVQTADANGGGATLSPNQWHFITATYDGRDLRLYLDGRLSGPPVPHSGSISPTATGAFLAIGSEDGRRSRPQCIKTRYFRGLIDELKIYQQALSPDKIKTAYEAARSAMN